MNYLIGDHMFGDDSTVGASVTVTTSSPDPQDIPLALTTRTDSYIEYSAATVQQHQQSRPGVIVVKQVRRVFCIKTLKQQQTLKEVADT